MRVERRIVIDRLIVWGSKKDMPRLHAKLIHESNLCDSQLTGMRVRLKPQQP